MSARRSDVIQPDKHKTTGRWRARYTDPDGKIRSAGTFPTKKEAWKAIHDKEREIHRGEWDNPDLGMIRFADWVPTALNRLGKDGQKIGARTRILYEGQLRRHVLPTFGKMMLRDIKKRDIHNWLDKLPDTPNRLNLYMLVRGILRVAVEDEELKVNPAATIRIRNYAKDRPTLRSDQFAELLELAHPTMKLLLLVTWGTSARVGEVLGMNVEHLDLKRGTVDIVQQFGRTADGLGIDAPKNGHARLALPIYPEALDAIRAHLKKNPKIGSTPLLQNEFGRRIGRRWIYEQMLELREKTGLDWLHVHDIRHFSLTAFADAGAGLKEVMGRAGHSSMQVSLHYIHVSEKRSTELASKVTLATAPLNKEARR
jgi:integrase